MGSRAQIGESTRGKSGLGCRNDIADAIAFFETPEGVQKQSSGSRKDSEIILNGFDVLPGCQDEWLIQNVTYNKVWLDVSSLKICSIKSFLYSIEPACICDNIAPGKIGTFSISFKHQIPLRIK